MGEQNLAKRATVHTVSENWAKEAGFVRTGLWGIQASVGYGQGGMAGERWLWFLRHTVS